MSRRGTNIFELFAKGVVGSAMGKITWYSNMWAKVGSKWDQKRIQNKNLAGKTNRVNALGEWEQEGLVLVSRPCVINCPCPPGDDFVNTRGSYWVPRTECKKCPYHIPATRRVRFSCCEYRKSSDPEKAINDTLESVFDRVSKNVGEVLNS